MKNSVLKMRAYRDPILPWQEPKLTTSRAISIKTKRHKDSIRQFAVDLEKS